MSEKFSPPEPFKSLFGWISGVTGIITTIVGLVILWQGNQEVVSGVVLTLGVLGLWVSCLYVGLARKKPTEKQKLGDHLYGRWLRRIAIIGIAAIPCISILCLSWYVWYKGQPSDKTIILIANFDGPESQKYRVTETILAHLQTSVERYDDVIIKSLGHAIVEGEGKTHARSEGEKHKAAIVIWGWYGVAKEAVELSVHFEVMNPVQLGPALELGSNGEIRVFAAADVENFTLQTRLSNELTVLSLFGIGMVRYARQDWEAANSRFTAALNQTMEYISDRDRSVIYLVRGTTYYNMGDYDRAITDYTQSLALDLNHTEAYDKRAAAWVAKQLYDRALVDLNESIQLDANQASTYANRGHVYLAMGCYEQAVSDLKKALQLQSDSANTLNGLGAAYYASGDYDQALVYIREAIKLDPNFAEAYNHEGQIHLIRGKYQDAIIDLDHAIQLKPNMAAAYMGRGQAYYWIHQFDQAIKDYSRAIELNPNAAIAYNDRANAYGEKKDYDTAIRDYDKAIQLKPDLASAYLGRANAYFAKQNYDQVISDLTRAIQIEPNWVMAYVGRGQAYQKRGDHRNAMVDYQRALELTDDPNLKNFLENQLKLLESNR